MAGDYEIALDFDALIRWGNMTFNLGYSWVGFYIRSISYTIFLGLFWHRKTFYGGHWLQLPRTVDACLLTRLEKKRPSSAVSFLSLIARICHTLHSLTLNLRPVSAYLDFATWTVQVALAAGPMMSILPGYVPMTFINHFQVRNLTWYVALDASYLPFDEINNLRKFRYR